MNDNTRRQWDVHQRDMQCADCAWLLFWLVDAHDASKGVTHPGYQRLEASCRRSPSWVANHLRHLEEDGHIVLVKAGKWSGRGHGDAAEYEIPWLHNPPPASVQIRSDSAVDNHRKRRNPSLQIRGEKRSDERGTSSLLTERTARAGRAANRPRSEPTAPGRTDADGAFHPAICGCPECTDIREGRQTS